MQAAFQILQFMLIGFLTMPAAWGEYLPLNLGNRMLTTVMLEGTRLWQFSSSELLTLLLVNLAYLAIGLIVFGKLERRARDRGLLGHY